MDHSWSVLSASRYHDPSPGETSRRQLILPVHYDLIPDTNDQAYALLRSNAQRSTSCEPLQQAMRARIFTA